jgi:CheY-like chemotaxis protein
MKEAAELIEAVATLFWPLLVLFLLFRFAGAIKTVVESASRRKFSLKIAGNELSMDEFSEQQIRLLADVQAKLAELENKMTGPDPAPGSRPELAVSEVPVQAEAERPIPGTHRVLWVDDNPRNNSYLTAVIEERGGRVDIALSTDEALRKFAPARYDAVISDMGRPESDRAGLDLASRIRSVDEETPILIFCGSWAAQNMANEAQAGGVSFITSSGSKLLTELGRIGIV